MNTDNDTSTRRKYVPPRIRIIMIPAASLLAASDEPPGDNVILDYDPETDGDGGGLSKRNHYFMQIETEE